MRTNQQAVEVSAIHIRISNRSINSDDRGAVVTCAAVNLDIRLRQWRQWNQRTNGLAIKACRKGYGGVAAVAICGLNRLSERKRISCNRRARWGVGVRVHNQRKRRDVAS